METYNEGAANERTTIYNVKNRNVCKMPHPMICMHRMTIEKNCYCTTCEYCLWNKNNIKKLKSNEETNNTDFNCNKPDVKSTDCQEP